MTVGRVESSLQLSADGRAQLPLHSIVLDLERVLPQDPVILSVVREFDSHTEPVFPSTTVALASFIKTTAYNRFQLSLAAKQVVLNASSQWRPATSTKRTPPRAAANVVLIQPIHSSTVLKVTGLPAQVSEGSHGQVVRPGYYAVRVTIAGLPKRTRYVLRGHSSHEFNEYFTFMGQMLQEKDPDITVEVFRRGVDNAEIAVSSAKLPLTSFKDKRKDTHRAIELPGGVTVHCAVKWSGLKDIGHSLMFATCTISRASAAAAASTLGDAKTERAWLGGSKEAEEEPQEDEHVDEYKDDDDEEEDGEEDEEELRRWREEDDADLKRAKPSALQVLLRAMDGEDDDDERRSPRPRDAAA
ncbi:hypothetical protein P43SY_011798 [Pythium insidiosum]|uniref:C2 domain-containing protein n=1 Tax=Pythium insidiosum TaxID=114742 RepID=A0AAD5L968_PYTIN|nr:hypothetical protein P43SY_011798 [Pythium insidiosum]